MDKESKSVRIIKALTEAGLLKTDNPTGFWGKVTLTCQANKIVHAEKIESVKVD